MPPMDSKVVGVLGEIARGELRWYLTLLQGLGGQPFEVADLAAVLDTCPPAAAWRPAAVESERSPMA